MMVDEVFPERPVRQWVLSVPYPLRFLFASRPDVMGELLGIVYRCIATHQLEKAPDIGRPFLEMPELRELVIAFGDSGYVLFSRHEPADDAVYVLAFRHQKEAGY